MIFKSGNRKPENTLEQSSPQLAIVTALPLEYVAVEALLDNVSQHFVPGRGAGRRYLVGSVAALDGRQHKVVLTLLPDMGNNLAASQVTRLLAHFPSVNSIFMVGIAGGVPHPHKPEADVRLGDIVVSDRSGVVQYDYGAETITEIIPRHPPRPPSAMLLEGIRHLEAAQLRGTRHWEKFIRIASGKLNVKRPSSFATGITTPNDSEELPNPPNVNARQEDDQPRVFFGPIASANNLLRNPHKRDELRDKFGVKAIEMEGSGVADAAWHHGVGYLIVRGICDYCDQKKNNLWQQYAAVVAAAYVRALLESIPCDEANEKAGEYVSESGESKISSFMTEVERRKVFKKELGVEMPQPDREAVTDFLTTAPSGFGLSSLKSAGEFLTSKKGKLAVKKIGLVNYIGCANALLAAAMTFVMGVLIMYLGLMSTRPQTIIMCYLFSITCMAGALLHVKIAQPVITAIRLRRVIGDA
jgi:nucleoside phosphorylase